MQGSALRLWIDDRNPIFRRGLIASLPNEGFRLTGESAGLRPFPEVGTLDILLFEAETASLTQVAAMARQHGVRLMATVGAHAETLIYDVVAAGAAAVLLRSDLTPNGLVTSLRAVATGTTALPADILPVLLDRAAKSGASGPHPLSSRELAVLRFLSEGEDTREIADALGYSERTVKNIVHDLLMKTNCRNRAHAVAMATRQGLI